MALALAAAWLSVTVTAGAPPASGGAADQRVSSLDDALDLYARGDFEVVARSFTEPRDFHRLKLNNRDLDRWLATWDRGKALLLLELARTSAGVAPQYVNPLLRTGRRYVTTRSAAGAASPDSALFIATWNRAALAIAEHFGQYTFLEDLTDAMARDATGFAPAPTEGMPELRLENRLALARGVAQEQRCWSLRPWIELPGAPVAAIGHAAGMSVRGDRDGPSRAVRDARLDDYQSCLREAVARFETATADEESRAEARVRGGWVLFQAARFQEALDWFEAAVPGDDRELAYWRHLFRGRAFGALTRFGDAAGEYQTAVTLFPFAQTAAVGQALSLLLLDRDAEADAVARALRAAPAAPDPWARYMAADHRFLSPLLNQLRAAMR